MKPLPLAGLRPLDPLPKPPPAGFALWAMGFRPFFLGAAVWAAAGVLVWPWLFGVGRPLPAGLDPLFWHRHEMLYGFTAAVICGFLLSAPGSWTGLPMPRGRPLAALFLLWVAGRVVLAVPACPNWLAMAVNVPLLPVMAGMVVVPVLRKNQWRNAALLILPCALAAVQAAMHLGRMGVLPGASLWAGDAALMLVLVLVSVIGGRVMPFFTSRGLGLPPPQPLVVLNWVAPVALLAASVLHIAGAGAGLRTAAWLVAGVTAAVRLVRWYRPGILGNPLLWSLHAAFAFLVLGCLFQAFAAAGWVAVPLARHALTVGCVGMVCISMMSRVARGHTGRPLRVDAPTLLALRLVLLSAFVRVFLPLAFPALYLKAVTASGLMWAAAFAIWFAAHLRMLTRPG